jgi:hypothetical protein
MASSPTPIATSLTSSKARIASVPVWLDDSQLNPQWIRLATGLPAVSCTTIDRSNETRKGKSPALGATVQLLVSLMESTSPPPTSRDAQDSDNKAKPSSIRLMLKQVPESGLALSKTLGLAREALFTPTWLQNWRLTLTCCPKSTTVLGITIPGTS